MLCLVLTTWWSENRSLSNWTENWVFCFFLQLIYVFPLLLNPFMNEKLYFGIANVGYLQVVLNHKEVRNHCHGKETISHNNHANKHMLCLAKRGDQTNFASVIRVFLVRIRAKLFKPSLENIDISTEIVQPRIQRNYRNLQSPRVCFTSSRPTGRQQVTSEATLRKFWRTAQTSVHWCLSHDLTFARSGHLCRFVGVVTFNSQ